MTMGVPSRVPPGFRVRGSYDAWGYHDIIYGFRAADTSHPTRVHFSQYGTVELVPQDVNFPTDRSPSEFETLPATVEIPGKARVTFDRLRLTLNEYDTDVLAFDVTMANLNAGYDTQVNLSCNLLDGLGRSRGLGGEYFIIGPGQTVTMPFAADIEDARSGEDAKDVGTDDAQGNHTYLFVYPISKGKLDSLLGNAKIVCTGDIEAIFNASDVSVDEFPLPLSP